MKERTLCIDAKKREREREYNPNPWGRQVQNPCKEEKEIKKEKTIQILLEKACTYQRSNPNFDKYISISI